MEGDSSRTVLYVQPTTGGHIEISVPSHCTVSNLKVVVAKRLKVHKDKIILLHKNKQLTEGSLSENNILEGSKLTLLPNIETGIMPQNPEQCVIQALQTLSESQVDNFLAGRSPLNLTMRIGDHMMFVQLQLGATATTPATSTPPTPSTPTTPPTTPPSEGSSSSATANPLLTPPATPTSQHPHHFPLPPPQDVANLPSPPPSPTEASPAGGGAAAFDSPKVLSEASRNLTQTLRQLSSSALANKMNETCNGRCCFARRNGGAVIESMFHHGKGVFSGTFSGTLSPFLQDQEGRPRRNICTIVHILNDLLGASSHCNPPSPHCTCPPTSTPAPPPAKAQRKDKAAAEAPTENLVLRQKVEQIQSLLREKRQRRRGCPYPRPSTKGGEETAVA